MYDKFRIARRLGAPGAVALCLAATAAAAQEGAAEDSQKIDEIAVTATPLSRTVEELAQPTSVLTSEELALKQSTSIGETLSGELGVSSTYFGPVASRPVIRGQYGERVLVLSNGLDSLDASALSEDHQAAVEGVLAERIEIVRGPATLLYGSGAAGGIVNVVDHRIVDERVEALSGAAALGTASATGERSGAARVTFGTGVLAVHLDGFRRETDDVEIPGFAESELVRALEEAEHEHEGEEHEHEEEEAFGVVENTDSETDGGALGLSWTADRGYVGVAVSSFGSNYGIPGHHHHHEEEEGEEPGAEPGDEAVRIDLEQRRVDVRGEYEFDGPIRAARFALARSDYEHLELEGVETGTRFDTLGTDARLELTHAPLGKLEGAFGFQSRKVDFNAVGEEAFVPPSDTFSNSLFLFEEYGLNDPWRLQASARVEHQSIEVPTSVGREYEDTAYGASIGAIWTFRAGMSLAANYALTERHPTATELFADGPHLAVNRIERGSMALGDGFLDKERSSNLDVTLRGGAGVLDWLVTAFVNDVDDYILLTPSGEELGELPVFEYTQTDARFYGYEAEARFALLDRAAADVHATVFSDYVYAEDENTGAYIPRLSPLRYGIALHYVAERVSAGIEAVFHAEQDKTAPNELPTGDYQLLGAEVSYRLENPGLFLFLRGTNLMDEDARQHSSPLKDTVPLPGRSVHVGLRYDF